MITYKIDIEKGTVKFIGPIPLKDIGIILKNLASIDLKEAKKNNKNTIDGNISLQA